VSAAATRVVAVRATGWLWQCAHTQTERERERERERAVRAEKQSTEERRGSGSARARARNGGAMRVLEFERSDSARAESNSVNSLPVCATRRNALDWPASAAASTSLAPSHTTCSEVTCTGTYVCADTH
jgi:hypothetical protein